MNTNILLSIIVVLIIFLISFIYVDYSNYKNRYAFFNGVWIGEEKFLEKSELSSLILVIKEDQMAITALSDNDTPIDESIVKADIIYPYYAFNFLSTSNILEGDIELEEETMFPKKIKFKLDILNGILILSTDEMVYAVLVKDNSLGIHI